jgi:hypothetical protein
MRENSTRTKKKITIRFAGGSMTIWRSRRALQLPSRRSIARRCRAISWFKDSATEHLARVRELVTILETHGVPVRMLKAQRVGYVVYEDEYQEVAEPFSDMTC